MNVDDLRAKIRDKYAASVEQFRAAVLGPEGFHGPGTKAVNGRPPFPSISHPSLTDRHAAISVVGDVAGLAWLKENPDLSGLVMTLSIAGRHKLLGERMSLPSGECDAWVSEIVGDDLLPYVYRAGTLSGVAGRASTVYYSVFMDKTRAGVMKPADVDHPQLRHLSEL